MTLEELRNLVEKAWSKETSTDLEHWTPSNPALGQCAVTALILQDFFGGELLRTMVGWEESIPEHQGLTRITQTSHYWNLLPDGREVDLTRKQFPESVVISKGELRTRKYVMSFAPTRKRYATLRLAVENLISPNPLFSDPVYHLLFNASLESECQKMRFGCVAVRQKEDGSREILGATCNKMIEPLRYLCEPECIRFKIQSRTESILGACGHAEEWALREFPGCELYIAGFDTKNNKPWIKKEREHTCLRCAVQMYMAGVKKIWVPVINRWESLTADEAVKTAVKYTLEEKKI